MGLLGFFKKKDKKDKGAGAKKASTKKVYTDVEDEDDGQAQYLKDEPTVADKLKAARGDKPAVIMKPAGDKTEIIHPEGVVKGEDEPAIIPGDKVVIHGQSKPISGVYIGDALHKARAKAAEGKTEIATAAPSPAPAAKAAATSPAKVAPKAAPAPAAKAAAAAPMKAAPKAAPAPAVKVAAAAPAKVAPKAAAAPAKVATAAPAPAVKAAVAAPAKVAPKAAPAPAAKATAAAPAKVAPKAAPAPAKVAPKAAPATAAKAVAAAPAKVAPKAAPAPAAKAATAAPAKVAPKAAPAPAAKKAEPAKKAETAKKAEPAKKAEAAKAPTAKKAPAREKTGRFEIKKAKDGRYVFNLYAPNHVIVATSQTYTTTGAALNGIQSIIANAAKAPVEDQTMKNYSERPYPKWELYLDKGDQYRFRLNAPNGNCIVHSQGYTSKASCKNGIESIIRCSANPEIDKSYLKKEKE